MYFISWFNVGDVFALTANPDDPTSLGTYKCEAVNCMGRATSSSRVRVVSRDVSGPPSRRGRSPTPVGPISTFKEELKDKRVKIGEKISFNVKGKYHIFHITLIIRLLSSFYSEHATRYSFCYVV